MNTIANNDFGAGIVNPLTAPVNPVALALFPYKFPNGQFLIPYSDGNVQPTPDFPENATIPGTAIFTADQAVVNLDWNKSARDTVSAKYYYQHDPTSLPTPIPASPDSPNISTPAARSLHSPILKRCGPT